MTDDGWRELRCRKCGSLLCEYRIESGVAGVRKICRHCKTMTEAIFSVQASV